MKDYTIKYIMRNQPNLTVIEQVNLNYSKEILFYYWKEGELSGVEMVETTVAIFKIKPKTQVV
jgi:hypothetical protein